MGKIYQSVANFLPKHVKGVFVEIGSERGEGSSIMLDQLAGNYGTKLITVDTSSSARQRYQHQLTNTEFAVKAGSIWAKDFAVQNRDIALLYLDNFDYIWDINNLSPAIHQQMHQYAEQGIVMNNQNCQTEHMQQIIALRECLAPDAVVVFDDTYCYNDCWIGKCGPAVVYLKAYGWSIVHQTLDCGIIMKKLDTNMVSV